MGKRNREEDLKLIAAFRDYFLSVISVGVGMGRGTITPSRLDEERAKLAAHEKKLVDMLEQH